MAYYSSYTSSRNREALLLTRCIEVVNEIDVIAHNQQEANFFFHASMLIRSTHLFEANKLTRVSELYFSQNPSTKLECYEVIKRGWILDLPRLRDMLSKELNQSISR